MSVQFVKRIILGGCGGHARSIIDTIRKNEKESMIILMDDNAKPDEYILGCKVERKMVFNTSDFFFAAIGDNQKREKILTELLVNKSIKTEQIISVVSSLAHISESANIGKNCFIANCAYIGPEAQIAKGTIVNTGSIIEHEVVIGKYSHIAPNATVCGRTIIGNNVFIGAGSILADKIEIADNVVIGAGTVVTKSILEEGTYVGNPARKMR